MEANSQSSESNNEDGNFFKVQLVSKRMRSPVKWFQFCIKNIALFD